MTSSMTKTLDMPALKNVNISGRAMLFSQVLDFLEGKELQAASNETILMLLGSVEGNRENLGKWIWFNLDGMGLGLSRYNRINPRTGGIEPVKDEEAFYALPVELRFYADDAAINAARNGYFLCLGIINYYDEEKGFICATYEPDNAARVVYHEQEEHISGFGALNEALRDSIHNILCEAGRIFDEAIA